MSDQADRLRQLVGASRAASALASAVADDEPSEAVIGAIVSLSRTAQSLLFTSGKGGVGTSNLVLNLAIALGELGQRVLVVDADLGLANLDLLCGLAPRYDLGDVLAGRCRLVEAIVTGPGRHPDRARGTCHPDRCGGSGRRAGAAGRRAGRAGVGVRLRARGRRLGPRARASDAGGGGRPGGDRQHARADLDRRCARGDRPVPAAAGAAAAARRGQPGRGRPRRRPTSSTSWSPRAGSSWAQWSRRWDRGRCGPTPTSAWPSAAAGRSDGVSELRSPRAASGGWPAPWSDEHQPPRPQRRAGFFAALGRRGWALVDWWRAAHEG